MFYFAYGSNMSSRRLRCRVPSASFVAVARLAGHELRFHKPGRDCSSKCDAYQTNDPRHAVIGVVYEFPDRDKPLLDKVEGLGRGYDQKTVRVMTATDELLAAYTYYATMFDAALKPYHWYKHHVLSGATEHGLPLDYVKIIVATESLPDPVADRHAQQMAIYEDPLRPQ